MLGNNHDREDGGNRLRLLQKPRQEMLPAVVVLQNIMVRLDSDRMGFLIVGFGRKMLKFGENYRDSVRIIKKKTILDPKLNILSMANEDPKLIYCEFRGNFSSH